MKNRIGLFGAWLLATAVAVGVASQAVGLVADRVVEIPVQVPIAVAGTAPSLPPSTASTQPPTTTAPAASITTPPSNPPASTASPNPTTPATTTTTRVPPPSTTTTTQPPLDSGSFVATGGQVTAACTSANTITMLGAVPVAGWSLDVESSGPDKVRVDFESGEQESEVEIVCANGQLQAEISD